jgi:hypothetical protein
VIFRGIAIFLGVNPLGKGKIALRCEATPLFGPNLPPSPVRNSWWFPWWHQDTPSYVIGFSLSNSLSVSVKIILPSLTSTILITLCDYRPHTSHIVVVERVLIGYWPSTSYIFLQIAPALFLAYINSGEFVTTSVTYKMTSWHCRELFYLFLVIRRLAIYVSAEI